MTIDFKSSPYGPTPEWVIAVYYEGLEDYYPDPPELEEDDESGSLRLSEEASDSAEAWIEAGEPWKART